MMSVYLYNEWGLLISGKVYTNGFYSDNYLYNGEAMDITTELGRKTICISDVTSNLRLVHGRTVSIIDVQGNRYCVEDIDALSRENRQKIELYL